MKKRKIQWDKETLDLFKAAIKYIRSKSFQNADSVKADILAKVSELAEKPEIHPPDKYKKDNDGRYRAFELHRYRISYLVKETEIIIARFRHTSLEPGTY